MKQLFILILTIATLNVFAIEADDGAGSKGFKLFNIPASIASAGRGNTGNAFSNEAFSFIGNPTSSLNASSSVVSISNAAWFLDTNINQLGILLQQEKIGYGVALRYVDYGKLENRDDIGTLYGHYRPYDTNLNINFAYRLTPSHQLGVNAFLIYEKIDFESSLGMGFDVGYSHKTNLKGLTVGADLLSLGTSTKMAEEKVEMPTTFDVYSNYSYEMNDLIINPEVKVIYFLEEENVRTNLGTSFLIRKILDVRFGYKLNYDSESYSAGIGVKVKKVNFDYSYLPFDNELGNVHMVGVSYLF